MSCKSSVSRALCAATIALLSLVPLAGFAQDLPSYAAGSTVSTDETIHGRIRSVDGAFSITVDDDRGFVDNVQLHAGTIINPTGLTLSSGMSVTIEGVNTGSTFSAQEIDTPYSYSGPLPTPVYYGPGYWCPGFGYGYGPSFSLGFVFGGGYGPWSFEHRPFYGRPWDGHGYFGNYVGTAPGFHGRVEVNRSFSNPSLRGETSVHAGGAPSARTGSSHVPSAFAGRTFAGSGNSYSQVAPNRESTVPMMRGGAVSSGYESSRYNSGSYSERRSSDVTYGRPSSTGGSMRASAPAGNMRASAPASAHTSSRRH